jgi:hypothetical protein
LTRQLHIVASNGRIHADMLAIIDEITVAEAEAAG